MILLKKIAIENAPAMPQKPAVLLTAFRGTSSEKLIGSFDDAYLKIILENDKKTSAEQLIAALENNKIDYIISLGQKPVIKDKIYIELIGKINGNAYKTDFNIDKLASALIRSKFSAHISTNAGTSFCNNIYAHGLKYIEENFYEAKMVFIHIPFEKNISNLYDYSKRFEMTINELFNYSC